MSLTIGNLPTSEASQSLGSDNSSKRSPSEDEKVHQIGVESEGSFPQNASEAPSEKVLPDSSRRASSEYYDMSDDDSMEEDEEESMRTAGFAELFRFASKWDLLFNFIGLLAACAAGAAQPLMTLVFGDLTTSFLRFTHAVNEPSIQAAIQSNVNSLLLSGDIANSSILVNVRSQAEQELRHSINHDALLLVYVGIAMFGSTYIYMASWVYTGEQITRRIREAYLSAVLRQEIAYFDFMGPGEITTRIQSEIQLIQDGISDKIPMSVMFVATFVAGFIVAYIKSWKLSLAMSSILPCIVGAGAAMNVFITKYQQIELQYVAQAASIAEESLSSVRTAKAFAIEQRLVDLYNESNEETTKIGRKKAVVQGVGLGVFFFVIYSSYSLAFYFGSKLLASGDLQSGTVMTVIFSIFIGTFSLAMLAPNLTALSYALSAAGKVFETIDRVPKIDSSDPSGLKPEQCRGEIEFQDISFRYPARRNVPVLSGFSLKIAPNQTTALVGASGSGKSTIVSLLERYYDPDQGQVLVDGVAIKELNLTWLRTQIGFVSQEPVLFSTTIRENIEFGLINSRWESASKEEKDRLVEEAADQANAHGFIKQLPDGYDTLVGERGFLLSGGQKQRVAIARAIVSKPQILLLDEATSALDTQSEGIVQEALDRAAKGRTTIVIAHRLSTVKNSDKIVVMGKGIILEQGTHQELLTHKDGPYSNLVSAQMIRANEVDNKLYDVESIGTEERKEMEETKERMEGEEKPEMPGGVARMLSTRSVASTHKDGMKKSVKPRGLFYLLYRLAVINRDHIWTLYIPGIIGSIASGAVYPAFSILFGRALQTYSLCQEDRAQACPEPQRGIMRHESDENSVYFLIISILATIAIALQNGNMILASSILMERLRSLSLKALLRCDISHFDEDGNTSGSLTASLAENSQRINGLVGVTLGTIVQSVSTLLLGWIVALVYSWRLALPLIATSPLTLSAGFARLKLVVLKDQKIKKAHEVAAHRACEAAASIRTVAALTREQHCIDTYREELKAPAKITFRTALYGNVLYAISQAVALPTIALGFWYGSQLLFEGKIEGGAYFTVLTATVFASIQAGNAFSFVTDISQAHVAAEDSIRLLDNIPKIDSESKEGIILEECQGLVTFENVHFRYPTRMGIPVLRGLSFEARPGSYCALVGSSGCGKSTTIQLIERFYDPRKGRILIDGHDIKTLNLAHLRKHIALVSQEPVLFQGTIGWNIALGAAGLVTSNTPEDEEGVDAIEKVTEQQMRKAAKNANILTFIESLPDGFDTQVGGKGAQLSGGQKQRIAIARALIRDPKILLLDEATSALDSESEQVVQEALDKASKGRTTIAIAHRLSTISRADRIFSLQDGVVSEQGDHRTLMAAKGLYSELVSLQELQQKEE